MAEVDTLDDIFTAVGYGRWQLPVLAVTLLVHAVLPVHMIGSTLLSAPMSFRCLSASSSAEDAVVLRVFTESAANSNETIVFPARSEARVVYDNQCHPDTLISSLPVPTLTSPLLVPTLTSPLSVPTLTSPLPVPTLTSPLPVPTLTSPLPVPTLTSPLPVPNLTRTLPVPTLTSPLPVPTLTSPLPVPTVTSPLPPPASLPHLRTTTLLSCPQVEYDTSIFYETIISEFNLICERTTLRPLYQMLYSLGAMIGGPTGGLFSDRYGRKRAIQVSSMMNLVSVAVIAASSWYSVVLMARLLVGFSSTFMILPAFSLAQEVTPPGLRTVMGMGQGTAFSLAFVVFAGLGYLLKSWRLILLSGSSLLLPLIPLSLDVFMKTAIHPELLSSILAPRRIQDHILSPL